MLAGSRVRILPGIANYAVPHANVHQVPNKIEELCRNIRLEIDSRVQDVLDNLTKDCSALTKIVDKKVRS